MQSLAAQAFEASGLALYTLSSNGAVVVWNRVAEELYGYPRDQVIGRAASFLCFPGEGSVLTDLASAAAEDRAVERHRRSDGSEVFVELRFAAAEGDLLICARDVSAAHKAETRVDASREALGASRGAIRRLTDELSDARESERRRIARELHDDFKQRLTALGFEIATLSEQWRHGDDDDDSDLGQALQALVGRVVELGDDVRRLSHQLHPATLEHLGLAAALEGHGARIEARHRVAVRVDVHSGADLLPEAVALGLYRIAQEALENTVHHSGARQVEVTLTPVGDEVRLAIIDDGRGFDPTEARARGGLGLAGMEERARLLGGGLRIASSQDSGTTIEVQIPLATETDIEESESGRIRRTLGSYRLLETLGEGATATVYRAQEPPPLAREVAIKLYRTLPFGIRESFAFKAECQALARLRHPNVGQIHEAHTTDDGISYIVMEYVPGMPITDYCDRYRLDLRRRVELLVAVCEAVQYVHQKGVLHRDLKPSNVLVMEQEGRPIPKVVDFGIAKGLELPLAEGTVWTRDSAGTPGYVSPEVLAGDDADARSDVYALGVVLYKLLTGVLPAASDAEILAQLGGQHLTIPSRRLAASKAKDLDLASSARCTSSGALIRSLRGDLDWIASKALEPDPEARYAGAGALAEDLERHLRAEPILAGPPSLGYRLRRLALRQRAAVASAALALVALVGGLAATSWQARQASRQAVAAEQARREAEQVTEYLEGLFRIAGPEEGRGEPVTAREILDIGAERLEAELASQPRVRARLQRTMGRVYGLLGLYDAAQPLLESSLSDYGELLGEDHPETASTLTDLASVVAESGSVTAAVPLLEQALAIQEGTLGGSHPEVARTLTILAQALRQQGERRRPVALFHRAWEMLSTTLPPEHPQSIEALSNLGHAYRIQGDTNQARSVFRQALERGEEFLGPDHPHVYTLLKQLAVSYADEADYQGALEVYEQLLPRLTKVYGADHWRTLEARSNFVRLNMFLRRDAAALRLAIETAEIVERTLGPDHRLTAENLIRVGNFAALRGQYDLAEETYKQLLAILATEGDTAKEIRPLLSLAYVALARSDLERAEVLANSVLERIGEDPTLEERFSLNSLNLLASVALVRGDIDRAKVLSREILAVFDVPETPKSWGYTLERVLAQIRLGRVLAARGDEDGARRSFGSAVELTQALLPGIRATAYHAVALLHLGRIDEARPIAREALRGYRYPELIELCELHGVEVPHLDR